LVIYKYRLWPIVRHHQPNQSNSHFSNFCPSFSSIRSISRCHNLQSYRGSHLSTVQLPLGRRTSTSLEPGGTPDYHRSRQNWRVQFAKLDHPISAISCRGFRSLFILCGNRRCLCLRLLQVALCLMLLQGEQLAMRPKLTLNMLLIYMSWHRAMTWERLRL
jgi:hypothetical protein